MHLLLIPIGSAGDVHPFVGLGAEMKRRGHRVTVITNAYFEPLVRRLGLEFTPLGTVEDYHAATNDPDLWHPRKAFLVVTRLVARSLRDLYHLVARHYVPGETVAAASTLAFGARFAHDKLGVPLATIHLQPSILRSVHQPPYLPGLPMPAWSPAFWKRFLFWFADVVFLDRTLAAPFDAFRAELGLPRVRHIFGDWLHAPQRAIGLFPDWFAPPQPDWPSQLRLTGFPLFDERGLEEPPAEVERFLSKGSPPIVFTPGSAMRQGRAFFAESVRACQVLGRRGVLLTRFAEQIPERLPEGVAHFPYLPFSQLLPRSAALVHHGGIGTAAQALVAGVPQLVMPLSHDQPDNADRLHRLGVGDTVAPRRYRADHVADKLRNLINSETVRERCKSFAARFGGSDAVGETCRLLEAMVGTERNGRGTFSREQ